VKWNSVQTQSPITRKPILSETPKSWGLDINGGALRFFIYDTNTAYVASRAFTQTVGTWYHLAGTYDGNDVKLWLNGDLYNSTTHVGDIDVSTESLRIGQFGLSPDKFFNGTLDSVAIYNRTLSAIEIRDHAEDRYRNASGIHPGDQGRFFQYRVFMSVLDSNVTPRLMSLELEQDEYNLTVLNALPTNVSLTAPVNGTWINRRKPELNWTDIADDDYNYMNLTDSGLVSYFTFDSRDKNSTHVYDVMENNHGEIGGGALCGNVTGRAGAGCRFNGSNVVIIRLS